MYSLAGFHSLYRHLVEQRTPVLTVYFLFFRYLYSVASVFNVFPVSFPALEHYK
jgi:hypothetical protein